VGVVEEHEKMNLALEQWAPALTAIAAWVALGISLYNLLQGRPRRRVDVIIRYGRHPKGRLGPHIGITFINEQGPVVVVKEVGFTWARGRKGFRKGEFFEDCDDPLPKEVPPGHSASYFFELEYLRRFVRVFQDEPRSVIRAYCKDAAGRLYESEDLTEGIKSTLVWLDEVYRQKTIGTE